MTTLFELWLPSLESKDNSNQALRMVPCFLFIYICLSTSLPVITRINLPCISSVTPSKGEVVKGEKKKGGGERGGRP